MWPYYLSLGCSYSEYWDAPAYVFAGYLEAELYRREQQNHNAWLHGLYVYNAVSSSLAIAFWDKKGKKPEDYLQYPIAFTEREKEMEKQRRIEATLKFFKEGQCK